MDDPGHRPLERSRGGWGSVIQQKQQLDVDPAALGALLLDEIRNVRPRNEMGNDILGLVATILLAVPNFILGLVMMFLFALGLGWFPAVGYVPLSEGVLANLRTFAIPVATLALVEWPGFMLILRSDAIEVLQQDYILLAKAKGLRDSRILFRHVLKLSSFALLTVIGLTVV